MSRSCIFMMAARPVMSGLLRSRPLLTKINSPNSISRRLHHDEFPQPFDNMPFRVTSRFLTTMFFGVFFGVGLWAPFLIVWYSMAKRTL